VVTGHEVSRLHAEIRLDAQGYMLVDLSVNGTYVNGERIAKTHLLARADVIRIGNDEFRFYADASVDRPAAPIPAPPSPVPPAPEAPAAQAPEVVAPSRSAETPLGAHHRLSDTMHGVPVLRPASEQEPAPLASFLFRSGELKGRRLSIKVPVANIGRGEYNDVIIADPSVSTMHAKLQRRDAIWILTDLGSTNGTFVEGERLTGEVPLGPGTTLRFGDVSALFEPLDESAAAPRPQSTRAMPRLVPEAAPPAQPGPVPVESRREVPQSRPQPRRPIHVAPARPKSPSTIMVVGLLILVAILAYLLSTT
jgi:pSer/pThr/pTyr-binding forkhead associated (FHA) protein